jgi:hypothetical protein
MKNRPEEIDARINESIEAWKLARQHAAAISEDGVRGVAERIADQLRDESIRDILAPLFKAAVKGKAKAKKNKSPNK